MSYNTFFPSVLIHSRCCRKIPCAKYVINERHLIFTVFEFEKSNIKATVTPSVLESIFYCCIYMVSSHYEVERHRRVLGPGTSKLLIHLPLNMIVLMTSICDLVGSRNIEITVSFLRQKYTYCLILYRILKCRGCKSFNYFYWLFLYVFPEIARMLSLSMLTENTNIGTNFLKLKDYIGRKQSLAGISWESLYYQFEMFHSLLLLLYYSVISYFILPFILPGFTELSHI